LTVKKGGVESEMGKIVRHLPHYTLVGIGVVARKITIGKGP